MIQSYADLRSVLLDGQAFLKAEADRIDHRPGCPCEACEFRTTWAYQIAALPAAEAAALVEPCDCRVTMDGEQIHGAFCKWRD